MFLSELNEDQKRSYLALATRMILADGDVAPEEDAVLNSIRTELGEGIIAPPEEVFGTTNADVFDTLKSRVIVVLEILVMAYSDQRLHVDEWTVLEEIRTALGVDDAALETMTAWARRCVEGEDEATLRDEAGAMMNVG